MSGIIKKEFKKSNIHATSEFDFYQLKRESAYLLNCEVTRNSDEILFEFQIGSEESFSKIRYLPQSLKYQGLINIKHLYEDAKRLQISLDPENLYYDTNMMPKAICRDVYEDMQWNEEDFVQQYKSLIGYVLQQKYTFHDFYEGGNQLLSKNKMTAAYLKATKLDEVVQLLDTAYRGYQEKMQSTIVEVDKKKYSRVKIVSRITTVLLIGCIGVAGYFGVYRLQEESSFNKANEAYIKQDYVSVIETLKGMPVARMNTNTKYVFAISNIKTEALNDEQKNNILAAITLNSDARILEFWIYLGKSDMDMAVDVAKQLGNKEYLAYAYMKEKAFVENDKSLSGAQRDEKLKGIEENIKKLELNADAVDTK